MSNFFLAPRSILFFSIGLSCMLIFFNAHTRLESVKVATEVHSSTLPDIDYSSPTGYASGQRVVLMARGIDGCHWIMNAQRMAHEGHWRIRQMPDDNAPYGRDMHWSQFLLWWLVILGRMVAYFTGLPLGAAIESASVWCVVPLHLILAIALPLSLRKVYGTGACALLAFGIGGFYPMASLFFAGQCDHHGIVTAFLLCSILYFCAGCWKSTQNLGSGWMVASGVFLGAGLWISAATVIPTLAGFGVTLGFFRLLPVGRSFEPRGLLAWSASAAISSFGFYLLEYFPGHMACRLEVNNSLYSLALLGMGFFLHYLSPAKHYGMTWSRFAILLCSLLAMVLPFVLIMFFKESVFAPTDLFLYYLHKDYIAEFQNIGIFVKKQTLDQLLVCLSPLPLVVFAGLKLFFTDAVDVEKKAALISAMGAAAAVTLLACFQVRWLGTANSLWLASLTLVVACVFPAIPERRLRLKKLEWVTGVVFMLALVIQMPQLMIREALSNWGMQFLPNEGDIAVAFARDTAYRLRALSGKEPAVVASGPTTTTWLMYFGGLKGLGTLYWENTEGLKATAALYASESHQEAAQIIKQRGISFIVFLSPEPCDNEYPRLYRGLPPGPPLEDIFATQLTTTGDVPSWARFIQVSVPENLPNAWAAVYDVRRVGRIVPFARE